MEKLQIRLMAAVTFMAVMVASFVWPESSLLLARVCAVGFFVGFGPYALLQPDKIRRFLLRMNMLDPDVSNRRVQMLAVFVMTLAVFAVWKPGMIKL